MNSKLLTVVFFVVSLIVSPFALADSKGNWWCGDRFKNVGESLKLTDEQQAKLKDIKDQFMSSVKSSKDQMSGLRKEIMQQVQSDSMDQSKLDDLISKKTQLIGTIMKAEVTARHDLYMLLTPEQKKRYQAILQKIEDKMAEKYKSCGE